MNALVRASLLIVLLCLSAGVTYAAGPPDIITNGDFSNGLDAWSNTLGTATVDGGSCGANTLYLETSGGGPGQQADVVQCINLTTDPTGTWTYAVGLGNATNELSLNANRRFSVQSNCTGATTGTTGSIDTFPGSESNITHPSDAESVEITILLTEGFSGAATACIDDVSFIDSGGAATAVDLVHLGAGPARLLPLGAIIITVGLIVLTGFARYRRTP